MHSTISQSNPTGSESEATPRVAALEGWLVWEYAVAGSTNQLAANLPVWSAVRADRQTSGRGRFQRRWVSDAGGLWLSAVVPAHPAAEFRALPLAVGLAVCDALHQLGVPEIRMRWPNDILVNHRKLAGLLVDQYQPGTAVAGIGINVSNHPETQDTSLRRQTARLADLLPVAPELTHITALVLRHLRFVLDTMAVGGFGAILPRVNALWGRPRQVELDLDGNLRRGAFTRVDEAGRLLLQDKGGHTALYEAHQVRHLTEL